MRLRHLITLLITALAFCSSAQAQHELKPLITVSADTWVRVEPDRCVMAAAISAKAQTAEEAHKILSKRRSALAQQLSALGGKLQEQGFKLGKRGADGALALEQQLLIETQSGLDSAKAIDSLSKNGAEPRSNLRCFVSEEAAGKEKDSAIEQASGTAKTRAQSVAKSLNITLGDVHSVVVTEDPAGAVLRTRKLWGESAASSDEVFHIIVTTRFVVKGAESAHNH